MTIKTIRKEYGFTLIELLIVVAIIAILAAIAIPNFLQAQIRSKVSKNLAEYQTMATAMESYEIDNNSYISTRVPQALTTPIAYLTSLPITPWKDIWTWGNYANPELDFIVHTYLVVTNNIWGNTPVNFPGGGYPSATDLRSDYFDYLGNLEGMTNPLGIDPTVVQWEFKTQGPDGIDDVYAQNVPSAFGYPAGFRAQIYDPSNGTVSPGDIVWFNNGTGSGKSK